MVYFSRLATSASQGRSTMTPIRDVLTLSATSAPGRRLAADVETCCSRWGIVMALLIWWSAWTLILFRAPYLIYPPSPSCFSSSLDYPVSLTTHVVFSVAHSNQRTRSVVFVQLNASILCQALKSSSVFFLVRVTSYSLGARLSSQACISLSMRWH